MPTNIDQLFEEWNPLPGTHVKSFARFVLEKHLTDEIKWLDMMAEITHDGVNERVWDRINQLKTELKP